MINKNNYAVYEEGSILLVGLILSNRVAYIPGWGVFELEMFNFPATQEDAEKCQSEIDARNEYYNHEVGTVVPNGFDIGKWRKSRKQ